MKGRPAGSAGAATSDRLYGRARKNLPVREDEALNALCDARLREQRHPLPRLLKRLAHELEK